MLVSAANMRLKLDMAETAAAMYKHVLGESGLLPPEREMAKRKLGEAQGIALGEIVAMHIRDALLDVERMRVDTATLALVSRLHNPGWYARMSDLFQLRRLNPADWTLRAPEDGADKNDLLGRN